MDEDLFPEGAAAAEKGIGRGETEDHHYGDEQNGYFLSERHYICITLYSPGSQPISGRW